LILAKRGLSLDYRKAAFPPLYPLFLAGLIKTGFPIFPAVRVVQSILGVVSCLLLIGITRLAFSNGNKAGAIDAGLIAALLMALYPVPVFYCARLMTENLFIFLILSAIYAILKSRESSYWFRWLFFWGGELCVDIFSDQSYLHRHRVGGGFFQSTKMILFGIYTIANIREDGNSTIQGGGVH